MKKSAEIKIKMPVLILASAMCLVISSSVEADRTAPRKVEPVIHNNVRYVATPYAKTGYAEARDLKSKKKLWELQICKIDDEQGLEPDVQDVFITSLTGKDGRLVVTNEHHEIYDADRQTKKILRVK